MEAFEMWFYRGILKISCIERINILMFLKECWKESYYRKV